MAVAAPSAGVDVRLFDRGSARGGELEMSDRILQHQMLRGGIDNNGDPGTVVLLTGDGRGFQRGKGFHADAERLHGRGWRVEILSWGHSCNQRMRQWAEANGVFIALDDYYKAVTYLEPSRPGHLLAQSRDSEELDLSRRPVATA